jgi:acetyl esterase/lipase
MKISILRWALLLAALFLAVASLLTAIKPPVRMNWQLRMIAGIVEGEFGLGLAIVPVLVGGFAWFVRRGHLGIYNCTIGFSAIALMLLLKPTVQAWRLGRVLPAQLAAAFGPATCDHAAFSLGAMLANVPQQVTIKTLEYADSLKLDFYPAIGKSSAPCIVAIHGGAWRGGDRKESKAIQESNSRLAAHGYAVASIDYRLAPKFIWPAQRDDVLSAIAYLREHAQSLGIDPSRFVLLGRSAGGQLAEVVGYASHDPGIRGVIAIYAPADLASSWQTTSPSDSFMQRQILEQFLGGAPDAVRAAYDSASGVLWVGPGSPPTLLMHGELDTIVPADQSQLMAEKLSAAGVPHALIAIPWGTHGFDYASNNSPGGQITRFAIEWFLQRVTR